MFKKLRLRIIASIMFILLFVFAGTLAVIYVVSYRDVLNKNVEMMEQYGEEYTQSAAGEHREEHGPGKEDKEKKEDKDDKDEKEEKKRQELFGLTNFYTVELTDDGSVRKIQNENSSGLTDEALTALAEGAAESGRESGAAGHMLYLVMQTDRGTLVVLMNNTIADDSFTAVFRNALIFGSCTMVILLVFSYFLSGRIIRPLKESFEKQKQFISDASHELKTPLSVIGANADLLSREVGQNKWLANIQSENGRMAVLINQLLQLARSENGKIPFCEVDLSRAATGYSLPFESLAFEKNIGLTLDIADGVTVLGSEEQLGQVVSILLDNAMNHASVGGTVRVELTESRGSALLRVSNTGEEIPADKRDKIFERFYRLDEARSREYNRYGLGLSIAKAIITAHKGKISVDCADGWTTFTVTLAARS